MQWPSADDALVESMLVVKPFELEQDVEQVVLAPDQRPVQQLTAAGLHPVGAQNSATRCDLGFPVQRTRAARERQAADSWLCD